MLVAERSGGRRDSGWRNRGQGSVRKSSSSSSSSSSSLSRRKRREKQQKVKKAQKLLEKHDPQHQQWKEEAKKKERAVELQEQAEVLDKVMKEQFDQTMNAVSPSLVTPPPFPRSPPGWCSKLTSCCERREEDKMICCGAPPLRWIEAELLHKVCFVRKGVTRDEFAARGPQVRGGLG